MARESWVREARTSTTSRSAKPSVCGPTWAPDASANCRSRSTSCPSLRRSHTSHHTASVPGWKLRLGVGPQLLQRCQADRLDAVEELVVARFVVLGAGKVCLHPPKEVAELAVGNKYDGLLERPVTSRHLAHDTQLGMRLCLAGGRGFRTPTRRRGSSRNERRYRLRILRGASLQHFSGFVPQPPSAATLLRAGVHDLVGSQVQSPPWARCAEVVSGRARALLSPRRMM